MTAECDLGLIHEMHAEATFTVLAGECYLYMHVCVCMYVCIDVCMYVCIGKPLSRFLQVNVTCVCICVHMYVCMHRCIDVCMYACI